MADLKEFNTGEVKLSNGEIRKSFSIQVFLYSSYESLSNEEMMEMFNKMLSALEIGAWRIKPQLIEDKERDKKYIRARVFLGKPEEYENIEDAQ